MAICNRCGKEFDEVIASGICPHCGALYEEIESKPVNESKIESVSDRSEMIDPRWLPIGTLLNGRYRVQKVIGAGGFGITYKAIDEKTGIYKAVKEYFQSGVVNRIPGTTEVLISAPKRKEEFEYGKKRLLNEAQIVARFQSAGIVRVDDYFEENGTSYMVMEFLDSQTLEDYMISRRRLMTTEEVVNIGVRISEALEEIHRAGVVHRDIAPDNLFINTEGEVKIIDFGSARLSKEDTDDRLIVLKPGFAPPEQYEKIDPKNDRQKEWTDVYALGATLYLCLTGTLPPESSDRKADADNGEDRLKEPKQINPNIPEWLNNTIMTAMAIDTHERFKDAGELKAALLQERKVLSIEKVRKRRKLRRTTGIAVSFAIVALLVAFGIRRYYVRRAQEVLKPADVSVWYIIDDRDDANSMLDSIESGPKNLSAEFENDVFAEVTVTFRGIPESDYVKELTNAAESGTLPNIFEYPGVDGSYMDALSSVDSFVSAGKDCYFLSEYKKYYKTQDRLPTAFNIPIVYINKSLVADYTEDIKLDNLGNLLDICGYAPICVKPELKEDYEEMYPEFADYAERLGSSESIDNFLINKESVVYFGDSSDFYAVKNGLPGSFAMELVDSDHIICHISAEWCMRSVDENSDAASGEILKFLLTGNAQGILYVQTISGLYGLPMNKDMFADYPMGKFKELIDEVISENLLDRCTIYVE